MVFKNILTASVASLALVAPLGAVAQTAPAPATEAPATEAPAVEAPATEAPAAEAPAVAAPATEAPATDMTAAGTTAEVVIVAPEGFVLVEPAEVTADQLKGANIYDAAGDKVAEIGDLEIGADGKVTGIIADVGGFLGMGVHKVMLPFDTVKVYRNDDSEVRAYITPTKDELKAMPEYTAP